MENVQYFKILSKNWELIALFTGLAIVIALVVSLFSPFQYSASTKILIIQKQEQNLDAYTATKSAERIGKNLASIIYTSVFYNEVLETNSELTSKFPSDPTERRKAWKKNIEADVIPESGILEITVYDVDRGLASQLVKTIAYVLVNKGSDYHGGGTDVEIKVVDDVFISKYPVRPNVALNLIVALIAGLVIGSYYVILRASRRMQRYQQTAYHPHKVYTQNDQQGNNMDSTLLEDKSFGFDAEYAAKQKNTKIITMHDHLK
ncbi:MAG: Wzz/FepE/Etk N-terminal domain-containing protein [Candidatus Parcubacteria bacterium]|nr:Wzz/FepE/Etk N-terminal domain-containing protein [Candidatus Parcubacteria bacterium]